MSQIKTKKSISPKTNNFFNIKTDIYDIVKINQYVDEKILLKDFIFFEQVLPKIDSIDTIEIQEGHSFPHIINTNYFATYGILHEFIQMYNKIEKKTFDYFCRKILEKKELDINTLAKIICNREKKNIENIKTFDFSHPDFFIQTQHQNFHKGSDLKNVTFCYNNTEIYMNMLNIFLEKKLHKDMIFLIKLPSIINCVNIDILQILCYIFDNTILFKIIKDSFFKDSFHVICSNINLNKYETIQSQIKTQLQKKKIKNLNSHHLQLILPSKTTNTVSTFQQSLQEFSFQIINIILTYFFNLQSTLQKDISYASRNEQNWKYLDNYYNKF